MPAIPAELLEQFGNGPMTAEAINIASQAFKKALIERALGGRDEPPSWHPAGATKPVSVANQRNGSFEPLLIAKHERCFTGFDDKIIACTPET